MSETAPTAALTSEIATAATDPKRWHYGDRFTNDDPVLAVRGGAKGLALYDELERDPQVACCLATRRMALLGREWSIQAGSEDAPAKAAADLVERALKGARLNAAVEQLLDALLRGVAVAEVMWVLRAGELLPAELRGRDFGRFGFRLARPVVVDTAEPPPIAELRLLTKAAPMDGEAVPDRKFVLHRHGTKYSSPWGLGLGSRLFWPVFFKRQGIGFWLTGIEKFGQPTAVGKYPVGTPQEEIDKLVAALGAISTEAAVAIPDGMAAELLEAKRAGTFDAYESLARYMDEDISKVILGQTLTTSPGEAGSRALGTVHNEVRLELTKGDADLLSDSLNSSLVRWIVDLNLPGYAALGLPYPMIWWDVAEPEDLTQRAARDTQVRQLGYRPTQAYIDATYGEGWEPAPQAAPAPGGDPFGALFAEAGRAARLRRRPGRFEAAEPARDAADDLADQLDTVARPAQDAIIDAVRHLVNDPETKSLEDVRDGLARLLPNLPVQRLAELMGAAFVTSALTGRADVADGG